MLATWFKKKTYFGEETKAKVLLSHHSDRNSDFPFEVIPFVSSSWFGIYTLTLKCNCLWSNSGFHLSWLMISQVGT